VRAIVEEVERHELYCTAHIHPDRAMNRAIQLGVHCIEHGTLVEPEIVKDEAVHRLQYFKDAGTKIGFGTDLLGKLEEDQCTEFTLRSAIFSNFEILHQATAMNAEIMGQKDRLGVIKPGAFADILVVDGNPLEDIAICAADGANFPVIMKAGRFHKNVIPNKQ